MENIQSNDVKDTSEDAKNDSLGPGLVVASRIINGLLGLLLVVIYTRLLNQQAFGTFFVVYTIYESLISIGTLGIPASLLYFIPQTARESVRAQGFGAGLALFSVALFLSLILTIFSGYISILIKEPELSNLLYYLAIFIILDFPARIMPNYLMGKKSYKSSIYVSLGFNGSMLVLLIVPAILKFPLDIIMLFFVSAGLGRFLFFLFYFFIIEKEGNLVPEFDKIIKQVKFAIPLFLNEMTNNLNRFLDKYFVMVMFVTDIFAVYSVSSRELPFVSMFPYALTTAIIPQLAIFYMRKDKKSFLEIWHTSMKKIALIMYPIFIYFFIEAENFIRVFFTGDYISGTIVFKVYLLLMPLRLCSYGGLIQSLGKPKYIFYATLISLFVNLSLNYPFIKLFGVEGAAIASILAQLVGIYIMLSVIKSYLKISWRKIYPYYDLAKVFLASLLSGIPLVLFTSYIELTPRYRLIFSFLFFLIVYILLGVLFKVITRSDFLYLRRLVSLGKK